MLSKAKIKLIRSLEHRKYRCEYRLFVAEGDKTVREMLASPLSVECLLARAEWIAALQDDLRSKAAETVIASEKELSQIGFLKTARQAMALVQMPEYTPDMAEIASCLSLYLDGIQDPGNLGAIIRVADWFGIRHVLCGEGCADTFGPKTVQATMGAIIRVKTYPTGADFLGKLHEAYPEYPIYGTSTDGENIYRTTLPSTAMIVMGNESKGISRETALFLHKRIAIPPCPAGEATSESLNVATATAIVCSEFRRQWYQ
ncbi:MAG: RNA methyltransferase [Bacteroidales bacterium]|jgi:TrmH family RNA methyltransferase|nr:RNA methyltransferase [Bacteroidales bacterium]